MEQPIYGKIVFGRNLTSEQWSKLQYRPKNDEDLYAIAENPSFGIKMSEFGTRNTILYNSTSPAEPDSSLNPTNETYDENSGNGSFDIDNNIVKI